MTKPQAQSLPLPLSTQLFCLAILTLLPGGFIVGFAGTLLLCYAFFPEEFFSWNLVAIVFLFAPTAGFMIVLGLVFLIVFGINWYRYRMGYERCLYCDRALRSLHDRCYCLQRLNDERKFEEELKLSK